MAVAVGLISSWSLKKFDRLENCSVISRTARSVVVVSLTGPLLVVAAGKSIFFSS